MVRLRQPVRIAENEFALALCPQQTHFLTAGKALLSVLLQLLLRLLLWLLLLNCQRGQFQLGFEVRGSLL